MYQGARKIVSNMNELPSSSSMTAPLSSEGEEASSGCVEGDGVRESVGGAGRGGGIFLVGLSSLDTPSDSSRG